MPRPPDAPPARLRAGARRSARRRSCTARDRGPRRRPPRAAARGRSRCRSMCRPSAMGAAERRVHLGADLVAAAPAPGPMTATIGASPPSSRTARIPSSSTPAARPRQPAWSIATARVEPSATGRQSAVSTIMPMPWHGGGMAVGVDRDRLAAGSARGNGRAAPPPRGPGGSHTAIAGRGPRTADPGPGDHARDQGRSTWRGSPGRGS